MMKELGKDARRVVALVKVVEALAMGERQSLGELATTLFGWTAERTFLAIHAAVQAGAIARDKGGAICANDNAAVGRV